MLARMLGHLSRYTGASLLLTVASIISFPILTRLFTVEEYGLLSYVGLVLTMLVGIAKLGMQHAAVRFRSEFEADGPSSVDRYVSTVVFGMALSGCAIALIWAVLSQMIPDAVWNHPMMKPLLLLTCGLIALRTIESAFVNLLKADEQSAALGLFAVTRRYVELAAILITLFFISRSLVGFYVATMVVEFMGLLFLVVWFVRHNRVAPSMFSPPLLKTMLAFSIPMIGYELASVVLSLGDRYVIQSQLGAADLGVYSAAYNLSDYIKIVLVTSVASAVMPVYLRLHAKEGDGATRAFLNQVLYFYLLMAVPVVLGVIVVGEPLVALVASEKYAPGAVVIPWVMAGMLLDGLLPIFGASLYIQKRSKFILGVVVIAATVNILANLLLVPHYGILGAAWATFGSYGLMLILSVIGARSLRLSVPWSSACRFVGSALVMALLVAQVNLASPVASLAFQILVGAVVYGILILALEPAVRQKMPLAMSWLRSRLGHG